MRRKRRIWIFTVVLAMAAVQGTVFAGAQDVESSVEDMTETTEADKMLDTELLMKTVKEQIPNEQQEEHEIKKSRISQIEKPVKKTADGQTLLDVSKGSSIIKSTGATGGGTSSETSLNPKGYRITGTTTSNCIKVEPGVTTDITLDNVSVTSSAQNKNCMDVSHANVTITLIGNNKLLCGITNYGALVKNGMDDTELVIQCEHAGEKGPRCTKEICGSLEAKGTVHHVSAIGNIIANRTNAEECGFSNFTVKGGIINAKAGGHNCAIGAACGSYVNGANGAGHKKYAKNIRIEGGIVTAEGGENCAGIGGGKVTPVDGIYITGGTVYASGGSYSPGIGSGGTGTDDFEGFEAVQDQCYNVSNIVISGGNTLVRAVGHEQTSMPGIGCGKAGNTVVGTASNICAVPDAGYQGYIQDGTSETEYEFTGESPFQQKQEIKVDKYFTMVYFGPFRDENKIRTAKNSWEPIISSVKPEERDSPESSSRSWRKQMGRTKMGIHST